MFTTEDINKDLRLIDPTKKRELWGQFVLYRAHLFRVHRQGGKRLWRRTGYSGRWVKGLVIGYRSLQNGIVDWYDDHSEWVPDRERIPCLLIVSGPNRKPERVPLELDGDYAGILPVEIRIHSGGLHVLAPV